MSTLVYNILRLQHVKGIGNRKIQQILETNKSLQKEYISLPSINAYLSTQQIDAYMVSEKTSQESIERIFEDCREHTIQIITILDKDYPFQLKHIYNAPSLLFYKGASPTFQFAKSIAIVGSRKPTVYGEKICRNFIKDLQGSGFTIVSGLASGVDSLAHIEALNNNLSCIAVVGHGLGYVYPEKNAQLYARILENEGCILSEHSPSVEIHPAFFPLRNRIIAGLARGTLVVEAAEKSGSLITAEFALQNNRDVFAVPGTVYAASSSGCNKIIKENKAKLVTSVQDILEEYACEFTQHVKSDNLTLRPELMEVLRIISEGEFDTDALAHKLNKQVHQLNALLTELELLGLVRISGTSSWVTL